MSSVVCVDEFAFRGGTAPRIGVLISCRGWPQRSRGRLCRTGRCVQPARDGRQAYEGCARRRREKASGSVAQTTLGASGWDAGPRRRPQPREAVSLVIVLCQVVTARDKQCGWPGGAARQRLAVGRISSMTKRQFPTLGGRHPQHEIRISASAGVGAVCPVTQGHGASSCPIHWPTPCPLPKRGKVVR